MCKINLCDQIYFQESNKNEVFQEGITMEKNIVSKVLDYMTKEYSPSKKLKIIIEKKYHILLAWEADRQMQQLQFRE